MHSGFTVDGTGTPRCPLDRGPSKTTELEDSAIYSELTVFALFDHWKAGRLGLGPGQT